MSGLPKRISGQKVVLQNALEESSSSSPTRTYDRTFCVTDLPANVAFNMNFGYMPSYQLVTCPNHHYCLSRHLVTIPSHQLVTCLSFLCLQIHHNCTLFMVCNHMSTQCISEDTMDNQKELESFQIMCSCWWLI